MTLPPYKIQYKKYLDRFCEKFFVFALLFFNRLRTSRSYLFVAPAHRAYRSYLGRMAQNKLFAYALIIVPISTLGAPLHTPVDFSTKPLLGGAQYSETASAQLPPHTVSDARLVSDTEIVFIFDAPVNSESVHVDIYPSHPIETKWDDTFHTLSISPHTTWAPGTHYSIALTLGDSDGPSTFYSFRSDGYPQITAQEPNADVKDFVIENGKSFDVILDRSVESFDFRIVGRDLLPLEQELIPSERVLRATIKGVTETAKVMDFIVYAKQKEQSNAYFYPIGKVTFEARLPQPTIWPKEAQERTTLAVERVIPKVTEGKYIDIDLNARLTTLFEDGVAVKSFVNSPGAKETPTLTGTFKVENKGLRPISRSFGVYLPYWMAFTPDGLYGIHDLVEWPANHPDFPNSPGGGKESIASIDAAVSPGCVRHDSENSAELYAWADVGTPIIIY